jgi:hypothetical protein
VTRTFCDRNFMRIAPHPCYSPDLTLWIFLVSCLGISKTASNPRTAIRVCRWTSFESPRNSRWDQRWHFGCRFTGMNQQIGLDRCIVALQEMESTCNEVNNGPLNCSWQHWDLEIFIASWDPL